MHRSWAWPVAGLVLSLLASGCGSPGAIEGSGNFAFAPPGRVAVLAVTAREPRAPRCTLFVYGSIDTPRAETSFAFV